SPRRLWIDRDRRASRISPPAKRLDELSGRDYGDALAETLGKVAQIPGYEKVRMRCERGLEKRRILRVGKISWEEFSDDELSNGFETLKEARDFEYGELELGARENVAVFAEDAFAEAGDDQPGFE